MHLPVRFAAFLVIAVLLAACGASSVTPTPPTPNLPGVMRQGYETYHETGGVTPACERD
jgi:hypothetical protein